MQRSVMNSILAITFIFGGPLVGSVAWAGLQTGEGGSGGGGQPTTCSGTFEYYGGTNASDVYVAVVCSQGPTTLGFYGNLGPLTLGDLDNAVANFEIEMGPAIASGFGGSTLTVLSVDFVGITEDINQDPIEKPSNVKKQPFVPSAYVGVDITTTID